MKNEEPRGSIPVKDNQNERRVVAFIDRIDLSLTF